MQKRLEIFFARFARDVHELPHFVTLGKLQIYVQHLFWPSRAQPDLRGIETITVLESQQQPNNKTRSKASANEAEIHMSAGCTRLQQRNNNEPATIQLIATCSGSRANARSRKNQKQTGRHVGHRQVPAVCAAGHQCRISGVACGAP
jgi:hypothetical protein